MGKHSEIWKNDFPLNLFKLCCDNLPLQSHNPLFHLYIFDQWPRKSAESNFFIVYPNFTSKSSFKSNSRFKLHFTSQIVFDVTFYIYKCVCACVHIYTHICVCKLCLHVPHSVRIKLIQSFYSSSLSTQVHRSLKSTLWASADQTKLKKTHKPKRSGKVNDVDCKQIRYQELNSSIMMGRRTRWDMSETTKLCQRKRGQTWERDRRRTYAILL